MAKNQVIRSVNHDEAKRLLDEGAALIDVRESVELMSKKVPGALHHPLSGLDGPIDTKGAKAAIFFCASGARTNGYAQKLGSLVDCDAYMLTGGIHALSRMDVPMEGGGNFFKLAGLAAAALLLVGWATGILLGS